MSETELPAEVTTARHVTNLAPGDHKVKIVVKGEKRPESTGSRVYLKSATIFRTDIKKNEAFKFSFDK